MVIVETVSFRIPFAALASLLLVGSLMGVPEQSAAVEDDSPVACTSGRTAGDDPESWTQNPRPIADASELIYLSEMANTGTAEQRAPYLEANYVITTDINLGGCLWTPIGVSSASGEIFLGTLRGSPNGDKKTVSGLFVDHSANSPSGFFGALGGQAEVTDLSLSGTVTSSMEPTGGVAGYVGTIFGVEGGGLVHNVDADIVVSGVNDVGGLVGYLNGGMITASESNGAVTGNTYVGGLVGNHQGLIEDSRATGSVEAIYGVGGAVGYTYDGHVVDSFAEGSVTSEGSTDDNPTGGLVGYMDEESSISGSGASGEVSAEGNWIGGLVGLMVADSDITRSFSTSQVTGRGWVGGLVGRAGSGNSISFSFASGDVTGGLDVGGFFGDGETNTSNSFASGSVSGTGKVGGFVGDPSGDADFANVYARGLVTGPDPVTAGGLLGDDDPRVATASFWDIDASGRDYSAGGEGRSSDQMKALDTFSSAGWDIIEGWEPFDPDNGLVWGICPLANDGYPYLLWQYTTDPCVEPAPEPTVDESGNSVSAPKLSAPFSEERADSAAIHLDLQVTAGQPIAAAPVVIGGEGLAGGSDYTLIVRSTPQTVASGKATALGNFSERLAMPALAPGSHTLTLTATAPDGSSLSLVQSFSVGADGTVTALGTPAGSAGAVLAATGSDQLVMLWSVGLAMLMLVAGVSAVVASRLRNHSSMSQV